MERCRWSTVFKDWQVEWCSGNRIEGEKWEEVLKNPPKETGLRSEGCGTLIGVLRGGAKGQVFMFSETLFYWFLGK